MRFPIEKVNGWIKSDLFFVSSVAVAFLVGEYSNRFLDSSLLNFPMSTEIIFASVHGVLQWLVLVARTHYAKYWGLATFAGILFSKSLVIIPIYRDLINWFVKLFDSFTNASPFIISAILLAVTRWGVIAIYQFACIRKISRVSYQWLICFPIINTMLELPMIFRMEALIKNFQDFSPGPLISFQFVWGGKNLLQGLFLGCFLMYIFSPRNQRGSLSEE